MITELSIHTFFILVDYWSGVCFMKVPETFRARKTIFRSSVSKTDKCMRLKILVWREPLFILRQLCIRKVRDCRPETFSGLSRNGPQAQTRTARSWVQGTTHEATSPPPPPPPPPPKVSNRELKHKRFWATNVNRKFMFFLLTRFHPRSISYKALILAFTTQQF